MTSPGGPGGGSDPPARMRRAVRSDSLLGSVAEAAGPAAGGGLYARGLYLAETAAGLEKGGLLLECGTDLPAVAARLASAFGLRLLPMPGSSRGFRLVGGAVETVDITLRALEGDISDSLEDSGFTIEAVAVDLAGRPRFRVIDPLGGLADLQDGRLKLANPRALADDPARVLHAAELCGRFSLSPETETALAMRSAAGTLSELEPRRVLTRFARIFSGAGICAAARMLRESAALEVLLPELEAIYDVPQNYYHHLGVWEHTLLTVEFLEEMMRNPAVFFPPYGSRIKAHLERHLEGGIPRRAFLAFAALIHDVGKAGAMTVTSSGRIRFKGHQLTGGLLARRIAARTGLGRRGTRYLSSLVSDHMLLGFLLKEGESAATRLSVVTELADRTVDVVLLSLADRMATRGEASTEEAVALFRRMASRVMDDYYWTLDNPPLVDGRDVMIHAGLAPGAGVADALFKVRVAQRESLVPTRESALEYLAPDFKGRMQ